MKTIKTLLGVAVLTFSGNAFADAITYTVDNLGGNRWQYNYTVDNTGTNAQDAFAIFFELFVFENLVVESTAPDWDADVFPPDPGLPDDGIVEFYGLFPILPGESLSGWSVSFDYLLDGTPGEQFFEFFDGFTFDLISDGITERAAEVTVPEPGTLGLLGTGLLLLSAMRRRQSAYGTRSK